MNSTIVNRELRAVIRPSLQTNGFTAFTTRTAWRYQPGRIEIVNFQSFNDYLANSLGCTSFSFSVNLSVYLVGVPQSGRPVKERSGQLRPEEWQGRLRLHPNRRIDQVELPRRDIWYVDRAGDYLVEAVRDARAVLLETGLPWFERWSTDAAVLDGLLNRGGTLSDGTELPGALDSPVRNVVIGFVAHRAGRPSVAKPHLGRALVQYEAMDASNAQLKRRRSISSVVPDGLRVLAASVLVTA